MCMCVFFFFFFSSRRRHTRLQGDWSSDVCSSDLVGLRISANLGSRMLHVYQRPGRSNDLDGAVAPCVARDLRIGQMENCVISSRGRHGVRGVNRTTCLCSSAGEVCDYFPATYGYRNLYSVRFVGYPVVLHPVLEVVFALRYGLDFPPHPRIRTLHEA